MSSLTIDKCRTWLKCYTVNLDLAKCSACEGLSFCNVIQDEIGTVIQKGENSYFAEED